MESSVAGDKESGGEAGRRNRREVGKEKKERKNLIKERKNWKDLIERAALYITLIHSNIIDVICLGQLPRLSTYKYQVEPPSLVST